MLSGGQLTQLVREGVEAGNSGRQLLAEIRAAGGHIEDRALYALKGALENEIHLGTISAGGSLQRRPTPSEVIPMETARASGYMQEVHVIGLNRKGEAFTITRSVGSKNLLTRETAIRAAVESVENSTTDEGINRESSPVRILAAYHGTTWERYPAGSAPYGI